MRDRLASLRRELKLSDSRLRRKCRTEMSDSSETRSRGSIRSRIQRRVLTSAVAGCAVLSLVGSSPVIAQIGPVGSSVNQPSSMANGERVLVLRTGRVMKGRIKKISTGWLVSTDRGNAVIPFEQVHFDADDLNAAYLRLRIQNGRPKVASHLRLAEWCLSQNILAEAARELRDALEKDPANETARLMLNRVDNEIRRRTPREPEVEQPTDVVILTKRQIEVADDKVRSLSGLSPETAREFVARIQPLLLNKCGNARCHGPAAKNDFQLTRLRSGVSNSRVVSERNLAAVLKDLQPSPSGRTRIQEVIRGTHAGKTIFNGRSGAVQMQTLQRWVKNAAKELSLELNSAEPTAFSKTPAGTVLLPAATSTSQTELSTLPRPAEERPTNLATAAAEFPDQRSGILQTLAERPSLRNPPLKTGEGPGSDPAKSPTPLTNVQRLLQEARQHVRKQDAFDPEDFNRRFAGSRTK